MVCIIPATGPCTIPANDTGVAPKSYNAAIPVPSNIFIQGVVLGFEVAWDNINSDLVGFFYRLDAVEEVPYVPPPVLEALELYASPTTLVDDARYHLAIRGETETEYGDWFVTHANADPGWNSDSVEVLFGLENVVHEGEIVLYS